MSATGQNLLIRYDLKADCDCGLLKTTEKLPRIPRLANYLSPIIISDTTIKLIVKVFLIVEGLCAPHIALKVSIWLRTERSAINRDNSLLMFEMISVMSPYTV